MLITSLAYVEDYIEGDNFRRIMMAKGQERSNKEAKKPKKDSGGFGFYYPNKT